MSSDGVVQTVRPMLDENRHKLGVNIEEGLPQVHADKSMLRQIFFNLMKGKTPIQKFAL